MKSIVALVFASVALASPPDVFFLRPVKGASVSFDGVTQMGNAMHRLEVRRLAFLNADSKAIPTASSCVIYYASDEYGPEILRTMPDCVSPVVQLVGKDMVEIFFIAGAHTHVRQRWKLLGHTAELVEEKGIEWHENPIHKKEK